MEQTKLITTKKGKEFWGPPQWAVIHIVSFIFKEGTEKDLLDYLWSLTFLLPCDYCREHFAQKLERYPISDYIKQGKKGVFLYSYIVHDLANQHITKYNKKTPRYSPTYEDVYNYYYKLMNSEGSKWLSYIWASIHILAATLRQETAMEYKKMLYSLSGLLPKHVGDEFFSLLKKYPIDPYLRNNNDAFFYTYMLHDIVNKKLGKKSPPFQEVKTYYFSSLGEECNNCKV